MDEMELSEFLAEWNNAAQSVLVHTSGSTGKPQPLWVEKRRMLASARITCDFLGLQRGDTALLCMPLDYIAGKMMVVRSIERDLQLISVTPSNHPLAGLTMAPAFAAMVPSQVFCSLDNPLLKQIKHLIIGGGAINKGLSEQLRDFPNAVWSTYGMTETLSHIALRRLSGPSATDWYTPFDGVTLSTTADGCLVIDAPTVHDGVLETNDIAEINTNGQFRIIGRKDNVICSGGIKLHIEDIEERLRPHLSVPFAITKRSDEKFGEVPVLVLEKASQGIPLDSLKVLDKYAQPKDVAYIDSIPLTETGKIRRKALLGLFADAH